MITNQRGEVANVYCPEAISKMALPLSMRRNRTPGDFTAAAPLSRTSAADCAGRKTVAVVFGGIVRFSEKFLPTRCHSVVIGPRTESYFPLTQVRSPTM